MNKSLLIKERKAPLFTTGNGLPRVEKMTTGDRLEIGNWTGWRRNCLLHCCKIYAQRERERE